MGLPGPRRRRHPCWSTTTPRPTGSAAGQHLPVSEHTAALITGQKTAVRERFPDTSPARLRLLPSRRLNPDDPPGHRGQPHRTASDLGGLNGPLPRADDTEYDKSLITPYSYRHSYAQRHADAGSASTYSAS
jgi:integrase